MLQEQAAKCCWCCSPLFYYPVTKILSWSNGFLEYKPIPTVLTCVMDMYNGYRHCEKNPPGIEHRDVLRQSESKIKTCPHIKT